MDDTLHKLLVDHEAQPELWAEGQEVVPVDRGEVRLEGAVLQPRRFVDLFADLQRGGMVHEPAEEGRLAQDV